MYPSSGKDRRSFRARVRASFRFPVWNAGWPQQVWDMGALTLAPNRSSTSVAAKHTPGANASAVQVKKRETETGPFGSIPVVYGNTGKAGNGILPGGMRDGRGSRPASPRKDDARYSASLPLSPVRMRTTSSRS